MPLTRFPPSLGVDWRSFGLDVVVRTTSPGPADLPLCKQAVHESEPGHPSCTYELEQFMFNSGAATLQHAHVATFAVIALILATLGIFRRA